MVNGPTKFRATHVKPYYRTTLDETGQVTDPKPDEDIAPPALLRRKGRPRKTDIAPLALLRRKGKPRKTAVRQLLSFFIIVRQLLSIFIIVRQFLSKKKKTN